MDTYVTLEVIGTAIGSSIGTTWLLHQFVTHLFSRNLETHKQKLQAELEQWKSDLQIPLEERKAVISAVVREEVDTRLAERANDRTRELERLKSDLQIEGNRIKAHFEAQIRMQVETSLNDEAIERQYRADAKRRLYTAIGPLRYQLLVACRSCSGRLFAWTKGEAYPTNLDGYFGQSLLWRLLLPLTLGELIQDQMSYADFSVDPGAVELLRFQRHAFAAFVSDGIVQTHPSVNWHSEEQHVFHGSLSRCASRMIFRDSEAPARAMKIEEFQEVLDEKGAVHFAPFDVLLRDFTPQTKPLLWMRLVAYGNLCNTISNELGPPIGLVPVEFPIRELLLLAQDSDIDEHIDDYIQRCGKLADLKS